MAHMDDDDAIAKLLKKREQLRSTLKEVGQMTPAEAMAEVICRLDEIADCLRELVENTERPGR